MRFYGQMDRPTSLELLFVSEPNVERLLNFNQRHETLSASGGVRIVNARDRLALRIGGQQCCVVGFSSGGGKVLNINDVKQTTTGDRQCWAERNISRAELRANFDDGSVVVDCVGCKCLSAGERDQHYCCDRNKLLHDILQSYK